jgi:ElaB/YqjD/DUF883 family membrane-anchored ribosome-binding protein
MSEATVRELEHEIERTRERMSQNLDELGERLSPGGMKQRARESLSAQLGRMSTSVADFVRAYPEQAIGVGLGLLVALVAPGRRRRRRAG